MATFKYEAVAENGSPVSGVLDARDATEAVIILKETYSLITELKEVQSGIQLFKGTKSNKIREKNLALVCKQMAIILTSGLPIVRSLELVSGQTNDKVLRRILAEVAEDVSAGFGLADSFATRGPKLAVTFIETLRAGEETGQLDLAFERLSTFFTKKSRVKEKVVSSLTYPAFIIVVAVVVIGIIMIFAVPVFTQTFAELGTDLPLPTRMLIGLSGFMQKYILLMLAALAVIVIGITVYGRTEKGRFNLDRILLKLPIIGAVQYMNSASQFANTLATMMIAGLPVVRALTITGKAMTNTYMGGSAIDAVEGVESGFSIGACLRSDGRLPNLLVEMTAVGEEAGSLSDTLSVVGEYYDNEVETVTTRAVSLLEPIVICFIAVFVVFILLSVYLPMFSMYDSIG